MMSPARLPALSLAAGIVAVAAARLGRSPGRWSVGARGRMLRVATAGLMGALAAALALSLVGVGGEPANSFPAIRIWVLASMAVAAVLIWRSRGSGTELP
jgi:hypothetical protein